MESVPGPQEEGAVCEPGRDSEVRAYLEKLLRGPVFIGAPRRIRLMRYLVERTLSGEGDRVNEYAIGIDVFDKLPSFDPRSDSIVRTDIARLRQRLRAYYEGEGCSDPVSLDLPPKSYRVAIRFLDPVAAEPSAIEPVAATAPEVRSRRRLLPKILAVAALMVMAAGAIFWWKQPRREGGIQSIVVLPFLDLSSGHPDGYLADGITDEITNDLANLADLRVIARTTAFVFKGRSVDVRDLGRQLHVDAVLEGSLEREGDRMRIRAQLNRASDGYHLWSHAYDIESGDLIQVQEEIARSISDDLQLNRTRSASLSHEGTSDAVAHDLYLRGQEEWSTASLEAFRRAAELFHAAIARDPKFTRAWLGLAKAHWNIGLWTGFSEVSAQQVESEARKALEIAPGLNEAHAILAHIAWNYDYDWPRAEREFRLALAGGGQANAHNLYGVCLAQRRRFAESHQQFHIAEELSPLDPVAFFNEGEALEWEGRTAEAERAYADLLRTHPSFEPPLARLAYMKAGEGDCREAARYAGRLAQLSPGSYRSQAVLWTVGVCRGDRGGARRALQAAARSSPPVEMGSAYGLLRDNNEAIAYLEKAIDQHEVGVTGIGVEPFLATVRSDPRFVALERRVGLAP